MKKISTISLFWGLFGIGMLPYYINRSVVSGQLQFILFPLFLSSAGSLFIISNLVKKTVIPNMIFIIAIFPAALSIGSLIQMPSIEKSIHRLANIDNLLSRSQGRALVDIHESFVAINNKHDDKNIGLFLNYGSSFALPTGLRSYLQVNNYMDILIINNSIQKSTCLALHGDKISYLIADKDITPDASKILNNCGYYFAKDLSKGVKNTIFANENI